MNWLYQDPKKYYIIPLDDVQKKKHSFQTLSNGPELDGLTNVTEPSPINDLEKPLKRNK